MATEVRKYLDITVVSSYDDEDNISAEIVSEDNDNNQCYVPDTDYYIRLYKSRDDILISAKINFGEVVQYSVDNIKTVASEFVIFSGAFTTQSENIIWGNFNYSKEGIVYNIDHTEYSSGLSYTQGSSMIRAVKKIFGIYEISYYSKYILYRFRVNRTGHIIISFVGE